MSTGFESEASSGRNASSAATVSVARLGHGQAVRLARVGAQDAQPAGVRDDRDAPTRGHGLVREQRRDVEHLLQRVGADHAVLKEEGVDGRVAGRQQGPRVRRGGALPGHAASGLHHDDRLRAADAAGEPAESARVPEALE